MAASGIGRLAALVGALAALAVAFLPPLEPLADRFLWAHMLQHELLIFVAPPLLLVWADPAAWSARLPAGVRGALARLTRPVPALLLSTVVLWAWHAPAAYDLALRHDAVHVVEHLCFFVGFILYWWPLVVSAAPPFRPLQGNGARVAYLLVGAMLGSVLAGLIAFAGNVLYTYYLGVPGADPAAALADQHLGGALMLFPGAIVYAVAALALVREEAA